MKSYYLHVDEVIAVIAPTLDESSEAMQLIRSFVDAGEQTLAVEASLSAAENLGIPYPQDIVERIKYFHEDDAEILDLLAGIQTVDSAG